MKRADLDQRIRRAARERSLVVAVKHGRRHDRLEVGGKAIVIPRHVEINEYTAQGILKALDPVFGKDWWR